jgi:hypothetical protein
MVSIIIIIIIIIHPPNLEFAGADFSLNADGQIAGSDNMYNKSTV